MSQDQTAQPTPGHDQNPTEPVTTDEATQPDQSGQSGHDDFQHCVVAIPVTPEGGVQQHFGRAPDMAVAVVDDQEIVDWRVEHVSWDVLHDQSEHGQHHARIVRFMRDNDVTVAAAGHMGPPMVNTLGKLGLSVVIGVPNMPAKDAVIAVVNYLRENQEDQGNQ